LRDKSGIVSAILERLFICFRITFVIYLNLLVNYCFCLML